MNAVAARGTTAPRLSRRGWLVAATAAATAALGAPLRAATVVQRREVRDVRVLDWRAVGELWIEQTGREALSVEAEASLLERIHTRVRDGRLEIALSGRVVAREPLRFRLEVRTLAGVEADGAGLLRIGALAVPALALRLAGSDEVRIAALQARSLDARLEGAGLLAIDAGAVERQRVAISGAADYLAPRLASCEAEVVIDGSGQARVAAAQHLAVRIAGSGEVRYRGAPRLVQDITGAGSVGRDGD